MSLIRRVKPKENYRLEVLMENGSCIVLNMESRLQTVRFGMLLDQELFDRVDTDGTFIRWDKKVEISVNELFQLAQK